MENKDNDLEEKKKWAQPGFALLLSPPALQGRERVEKVLDGQESPILTE